MTMSPAMTVPSTALVSHGEVDISPREAYGKGQVILRVGNGGAGATGLIKAIAETYLGTLESPASIEWICNHSRNTQLALLHGHIDVALTYERDAEKLAQDEGWSRTVGCVFHDHFCLSGPLEDPADILSAASLESAFAKIAETKSLFHSRADSSATMWKERGIWTNIGLDPWQTTDTAETWYITSVLDPAGALSVADAAGAYLLTDRSTLLTQATLRNIKNTTVFIEPTSPDHHLMNSCYALVSPSPPVDRAENCRKFLEYLNSKECQDVISKFTRLSSNSFSLFAPVKDRFARTYLRGGTPQNGGWSLDLKE